MRRSSSRRGDRWATGARLKRTIDYGTLLAGSRGGLRAGSWGGPRLWKGGLRAHSQPQARGAWGGAAKGICGGGKIPKSIGTPA